MKRKLSPWCKEVKKTLIDRDMSVTELCGEVGMCRNYVTTFLNLFLPAAVCVFTSYVINTNILSPTSRKMVDIHQDLLSKIAPITSFEHMVPFPILFSLLEMDA